MRKTVVLILFLVLPVLCVTLRLEARARNGRAAGSASAVPPASIPTFSTADIARTGFFYVGGKYVGDPGKEVMDGAMYVEVWVPKRIRHPYPIVFIHGAGQTGTDWLQTPDGRPGWAYYFIKQGYVLYMEDTAARGRSAYVFGADGPLTIRTAKTIQGTYTDGIEVGKWPQHTKLSQWPTDGGPNAGKMGDPIFDAFLKTQVQFLTDSRKTEELNQDADAALLDRIGNPVIIVTHSQGGEFGWLAADARPKFVKAIIAIEPSGPPMEEVDRTKVVGHGKSRLWGLTQLPVHYDPPISDPSELQVIQQEKPDGPGLVPCWLQKEPAHKLFNLENVAVLELSSEGGYHREYDHCDAMWLSQAGVKTQFLRMEDAGLRGNGHEMMLEKNSDDIAKFIDSWIQKNVR